MFLLRLPLPTAIVNGKHDSSDDVCCFQKQVLVMGQPIVVAVVALVVVDVGLFRV